MIVFNWRAAGFLILGIGLSIPVFSQGRDFFDASSNTMSHQQIAVAMGFTYLIDMIYRLAIYKPAELAPEVTDGTAEGSENPTQPETKNGFLFRVTAPAAGGHLYYIPLWLFAMGLGIYFWKNP